MEIVPGVRAPSASFITKFFFILSIEGVGSMSGVLVLCLTAGAWTDVGDINVIDVGNDYRGCCLWLW